MHAPKNGNAHTLFIYMYIYVCMLRFLDETCACMRMDIYKKILIYIQKLVHDE